MKKIFLLATSALLLLAGCAKEVSGPNGEGGLNTVTFTATMAGDATKAAVDGDGTAAYVNRCIMEVYYDGSLFERKYAEVTNKTATFTTQMAANRTYTVAFWADSVASRSALETDLYYTTNADGGLQAIALKGTYVGNDDARDAFFSSADYVIAQAGSAFNATLKRPFAQVNVITTDWDKADKVSNLKPTSVDVTIKNPLTAFNALTGVASTTVSSLTYNAGIYTSPTSGTDATLSMDYLFASTDKAVIDIDWKAGQGTAASTVSHSFANIPYQRNYRTNIKGNLLTSQGQWTVTVDPVWDGEHNQIVEVKDIQSANAAIQANASSSTIDVKFSAEPNDSGVPTGESTSTARAILTTPVAEGATLSIEVASQTNALYVGDYEYDYDVTTMATSTTPQSATVNINVPSTGSIGTLVINAPSKTVYINGKKVSSVGTITNLDAITSNNTLVIEANQTVTNLIVRQGALEIYGTVNEATVTVAEGKHVYVRDCEGLSQSVYNVLEPYIDVDNGYTGEQESGKETYRVYQKAESEKAAQIGDVKYYTLNAAFAAVQDGQTIELLKACSSSSTITVDKNVTLDLKTLTLTANVANWAINVANGKSFTLKNGKFYDGTSGSIWGAVNALENTTENRTAITVKDVDFGTFNTDGGSIVRARGNADVSIEGVSATVNNRVLSADGNSNAVTVKNSDITDTYGSKTSTFYVENYKSLSFDNVTVNATESDQSDDARQSLVEFYAESGADTAVVKNCTLSNSGPGNIIYAGGNAKVVKCTVTSTSTCSVENRMSAVGTCAEYRVKIYGGTYKSAHGHAIKVFSSGGFFDIYDEYDEESAPVIIEGYYSLYGDTKNAGEEIDHKGAINLFGDNINTKGMWGTQHSARIFVDGGYHDVTVGNSNPSNLILSGGTYTMDPRTNNCFKIADGYMVVQDGDVWKVEKLYMLKNVTKGTNHDSLQDLFNNASDGDSLIVLNSYTDEDTYGFTIKDKAVTLDLNSKTITLPCEHWGYTYAFRLDASSVPTSLTITDSSEGKSGAIIFSGTTFITLKSCSIATAFNLKHGTITCDGPNNTSDKFICESANGSITINGGKIIRTDTKSSNPLIKLTKGIATVNGGELATEGESDKVLVQINGGTLNVTGGKLKSQNTTTSTSVTDYSSYCIENKTGTLNVSGGELSSYSSVVSYTIYCSNYSTSTTTITGGTFIADNDHNNGVTFVRNFKRNNSSSQSCTVSGGTFKVGSLESSKNECGIYNDTNVKEGYQIDEGTYADGICTYTVTAK